MAVASRKQGGNRVSVRTWREFLENRRVSAFAAYKRFLLKLKMRRLKDCADFIGRWHAIGELPRPVVVLEFRRMKSRSKGCIYTYSP
jgi:hypothetical protein